MLQKQLLLQQLDTQQTQILGPDFKTSFITHIANLSFQTNDKRQIFLCAGIPKPAFFGPRAGGRHEEGLEVRRLFTRLCRHKEKTNLRVFITEI